MRHTGMIRRMVAVLVLAAAAAAVQAPLAAQQRRVTINQVRITDARIQQLERQYRGRILDGDYWHDGRVGVLWIDRADRWRASC